MSSFRSFIVKSEVTRSNKQTGSAPSTQRNDSPRHLNASSLRLRLGLDKWKCGSLTRKGGPCSQSIPRVNRIRINSLIQDIVASHESSSQRPQQLDDIAILAHCIFHERMTPSDYRMANWLAIFPGEDDRNVVTSIEEQIEEALGPCSARCRAANKCKNHIGGQKVQNYKRTISEIIKPEIYLDERYLDYFLHVLEANMFCPEHEGTDDKMRALQKTKIREIVSVIQPTPIKPLESNTDPEMEKLENQIQALALEKFKPQDLSTTQKLPNMKTQSHAAINTDKDPSLFWPIEFDATPLRIVKMEGRQRSSGVQTCSEIEYPLTSVMRRPGYIYIFEAENNQGLLKIGYTTRSVSERHAEWSFRCNRKLTIVYPRASETPTLVPNAYCVEGLIHKELDECRNIVYCEGCLTYHHEWFRVSRDKAVAVIEKWSRWMASHPYDLELGEIKKDKQTC